MTSFLLTRNVPKIIIKLKVIKKCMILKNEADRNAFFKS